MTDRRVLPYGSWPSPIAVDMAVAGAKAFREPRLFGDDVYWTEGRPDEGGRQVIVRWNASEGPTDLTPPPFNVRTIVHEYGGGWYTADPATGTVYFSNVPDNRIYLLERGGTPQPLTEIGPYRFGDLVLDAGRRRLIAIREDHSGLDRAADAMSVTDGQRVPEPRNELVAIDASSGAVGVLSSGYDFYSSQRVSADGSRLAWLAWNHPDMPWDGSELWVADVDASGALSNDRRIAGSRDESIAQPEWAPDGSLVFVSDRSGWWNLYRWSGSGGDGSGDATALAPMDAEFAGPQWVFGIRWYGIAPEGTIYAVAGGTEDKAGVWAIPLDREPPASGGPRRLDLGEHADALQVGSGRLFYVSSDWDRPNSLVLREFDDSRHPATGLRTVLATQFELPVDRAYLSEPEEIEFPTTDGQTAFAFYYPPTNPEYAGPDGERPPLVVMSHGGPTSRVSGALDIEKNAFTSRGFGVVDVNYRGSTGFGRDYMRKLDGMWGIYDVDDCIAAARYLAERGDVDGARLAIRGGSAGGYTTLAALTFHDVFAAGASHYGVGDLEALARFTHKFESTYLLWRRIRKARSSTASDRRSTM